MIILCGVVLLVCHKCHEKYGVALIQQYCSLSRILGCPYIRLLSLSFFFCWFHQQPIMDIFPNSYYLYLALTRYLRKEFWSVETRVEFCNFDNLRTFFVANCKSNSKFKIYTHFLLLLMWIQAVPFPTNPFRSAEWRLWLVRVFTML